MGGLTGSVSALGHFTPPLATLWSPTLRGHHIGAETSVGKGCAHHTVASNSRVQAPSRVSRPGPSTQLSAGDPVCCNWHHNHTTRRISKYRSIKDFLGFLWWMSLSFFFNTNSLSSLFFSNHPKILQYVEHAEALEAGLCSLCLTSHASVGRSLNYFGQASYSSRFLFTLSNLLFWRAHQADPFCNTCHFQVHDLLLYTLFFQVNLSMAEKTSNKLRLSTILWKLSANIAKPSEWGRAFLIFSKSIYSLISHTMSETIHFLVTKIRYRIFSLIKCFGDI